MALFLSGCLPYGEKEIKNAAMPVIPDIKIPCRSAQWTAVSAFEQGQEKTITTAEIYYREGKFRMEILGASPEDRQVMLFDSNSLYVLMKDLKAVKYHIASPEAEVFLRKVFVNTGNARKPEIDAGEAVYDRQNCKVVEYSIFRNINGLYAKARVREWRNKKGVTVKLETKTAAAEFEFSGRKKISAPVVETYEVKNFRCGPRLLGMLFELPPGAKVTDYAEFYAERAKAAGKDISPQAATFTVK